MRELPSGTVTLLFTDIEGSTRMLQELGREAYVRALTQHRRLLREAFTSHGGVEVEMQGDSFFFAFPYAREAVAAAVAGQRALAEHGWESQPIKVRIGLHTGEPMQADGLYAGLDVHRAARVMSAAHGGQIILSARTAELVDGELEGIALIDLGEHRLKDLTAPQTLYQAGEGAFPPPNALAAFRMNLPVQPTPLVGRERELSDLDALLARPDVRVLTLTGAGGIGKTRLAIQLAAERIEDYPDGVFACFLAPIRDPDLVLPAVSEALGLRDQPGRAVAETLREHLSSRRLLLLIDNLEHLLDAAPAVAALLAAAPGMSLIATSRAPLRIGGEHVYDVPPLSLPDASASGLEALRRSEAVALFCERAQAIQPHFELTPENAAAVAGIARRLDGLPLALELAASRVALLPPPTLLARLDRALPLLTGGRRDADERQTTLHAAIEWSYDLLEDDERALFRRLSVLVGSFTLEAAEAIAGGDPVADTLSGIASLHEKSLLRRREGHDTEPRFFMLETVREYAGQRALEHGEGAQLRRLRTEHFLAIAERGAAEMRGRDQLLWLDRLDADHDNLRESLAAAIEAGDADTALRLVGALHRFWDLRGHPQEGLAWAQAALALDGGADHHRALAHFAAGYNAYSVGNAHESVAQLEAARDAFCTLGDRVGLAYALAELAWSQLMRDDAAEVIAAVAAESLALARDLGERWCEALALQVLSATMVERRSERLHEAEAMFREVGDEIFAGRVVQNRCLEAMRTGRYDEARELAKEALATSRRFGDVVLVAVDLLTLGQAELLLGESARAGSALRSGLEIAVRIGNRQLAVETVSALAGVAAAQGDTAMAGLLHGASARLRAEAGYPRSSIDQTVVETCLLPARDADPVGFEAAHDEGRRLSFEAVVAHALEPTPRAVLQPEELERRAR